jgi:hypothetical protein
MTRSITLAWLILTIATPAFADSCKQSAGAKKSAQYVKHCLAVSPATRPPCNAENECEMIIDEIKRGCDMIGADAPAFCKAYR